MGWYFFAPQQQQRLQMRKKKTSEKHKTLKKNKKPKRFFWILPQPACFTCKVRASTQIFFMNKLPNTEHPKAVQYCCRAPAHLLLIYLKNYLSLVLLNNRFFFHAHFNLLNHAVWQKNFLHTCWRSQPCAKQHNKHPEMLCFQFMASPEGEMSCWSAQAKSIKQKQMSLENAASI